MLADSANQYLETFAPPETKENKPLATVLELNFTTLRFEAVQGANLAIMKSLIRLPTWKTSGDLQTTFCRNNMQQSRIATTARATCTVTGFMVKDKIYRQKIKPKPTS